LLHGLVFEAAAWTQAHDRWLHQLRFDQAGLRVAFEEADGAVLAAGARRDRLDLAIAESWRDLALGAAGGPAGCLRGVGVLTAFGLAVEVGDWHRFTGATIGAFLGLVPSRGKRSTISAVAVARELAGWCWSLAVLEAPDQAHRAGRWGGRGGQREERPATQL
jgi:hypothetical protein